MKKLIFGLIAIFASVNVFASAGLEYVSNDPGASYKSIEIKGIQNYLQLPENRIEYSLVIDGSPVLVSPPIVSHGVHGQMAILTSLVDTKIVLPGGDEVKRSELFILIEAAVNGGLINVLDVYEIKNETKDRYHGPWKRTRVSYFIKQN